MLSQQAQILLIDDDADVLDAYTMLLSQAGYQVQACSNPLKAQEMLGEEWPGIVISDVCMPGCSGIELMALLLAHDACLPVLLITGHGDVPMAVEAVKKGPGTSCKNRSTRPSYSNRSPPRWPRDVLTLPVVVGSKNSCRAI